MCNISRECSLWSNKFGNSVFNDQPHMKPYRRIISVILCKIRCRWEINSNRRKHEHGRDIIWGLSDVRRILFNCLLIVIFRFGSEWKICIFTFEEIFMLHRRNFKRGRIDTHMKWRRKKIFFVSFIKFTANAKKTGNIKINATVRNWFSACRFVIKKLSFLQ